MAADSTTDEVATWQVITGSARGAAHRASGLPNQDAVSSQDGPGGVVVAIADGHGHRRHFRSADGAALAVDVGAAEVARSEEHTSELQSPYDLVCRLLLEKKKKKQDSRSSKEYARRPSLDSL